MAAQRIEKAGELPQHPIATILAMEPKEEQILDQHRKAQIIGALRLTAKEKTTPPHRIILPSEQ